MTWAHFGGDGGDLITAAVTLGTPHPMGYPTYTLLGWLWQWIPLGTVAWRFNLFSAVCMAAATAMLAQSCQLFKSWQLSASVEEKFREIQFPKHVMSIITASLLFAFSPLIWQQAIITEVYALNLFVLSLLLWVILSEKSPFWIGLLWGLSLTTHLTSLLFAPLILYACFGICKSRNIRKVGVLDIGVTIGMLPFLILPLLARGDSAVVWGNARTLEGWWWVVSGRIYRPNLLNHNPILRIVNDPLLLLRQFAYIGWLPIFYGIWQSRRQTWPFTITALLYLLYAYTYDTNDYYVFALPALLLLTIPLSIGLRPLGKWSLLFPLLALILNFSALSLHGDTAVRTRANEIWQQLPQNSIALTQGDQTIFALWYFQEVEQTRPDVISVDANLLAFDWYRARLARLHPDLLGLEVDDVGAFITQNRINRPVCLTTIDGDLFVTCQ